VSGKSVDEVDAFPLPSEPLLAEGTTVVDGLVTVEGSSVRDGSITVVSHLAALDRRLEDSQRLCDDSSDGD
jgi:hypothetical protein